MVQTVLGLTFLATTFIITFLINNIQKYRSLAQEIQAKYIWSEDATKIPNEQIIIDYQAYRSLRTEIGITLTLCFSIFSISISALILWAIEIYQEAQSEHIWAYIILLFAFLVFLFQLSQFEIYSGDEGVVKIIHNIINSPVNGLDINFKEYTRRKIVDSKAITRTQLEKKFKRNLLGKIMFQLSESANEVSFAIITGQFVLFYYLIGTNLFNTIYYNFYLFIIFIIWILLQIVYITNLRKNIN